MADETGLRFERWETPLSGSNVDIVSIRSVLMRHLTTPRRHYTFGNESAPALEIVVFDESQEALFLVTFESVEAYRMMDDRDLMDHWCDASRAAGTTVKQWGGTWVAEAPLLSDERTFRYVMKGEDGSIEVVASFCEPVVRRLAPSEQPFTARAPLPEETEQPEPDAAEGAVDGVGGFVARRPEVMRASALTEEQPGQPGSHVVDCQFL